MGKLFTLIELFRKGAVVADPALWKNRYALALALSPLIIVAVKTAKVFGYDVPLTDEDATLIAGAVATVAGLLSTYTTSDKVGLPPKPKTSNQEELDLRGGP